MERQEFSFEAIVDVNLWAWEGMPLPLCRWCWRACGWVDDEALLNSNKHLGLTMDDLNRDQVKLTERWNKLKILDAPPRYGAFILRGASMGAHVIPLLNIHIYIYIYNHVQDQAVFRVMPT